MGLRSTAAGFQYTSWTRLITPTMARHTAMATGRRNSPSRIASTLITIWACPERTSIGICRPGTMRMEKKGMTRRAISRAITAMVIRPRSKRCISSR